MSTLPAPPAGWSPPVDTTPFSSEPADLSVDTTAAGAPTPTPDLGAATFVPSIDSNPARPYWAPNVQVNPTDGSMMYYPQNMRDFIDQLALSRDPAEQAIATQAKNDSLPITTLRDAAVAEMGNMSRYEGNPNPAALDPQNPADVAYFQWMQNRQLLPAAPGFVDAMKGVGKGLWDGAAEVLGNLGTEVADPEVSVSSPTPRPGSGPKATSPPRRSRPTTNPSPRVPQPCSRRQPSTPASVSWAGILPCRPRSVRPSVRLT